MSVTTVDLLRHGACEGGEIFRGSTDVALSEAGWKQMQASVATAAGWTRIISSSLRRCQQFAEELALEKNLPLQVEDKLREIHFGDWEGMAMIDVRRDYPEEWQSFFTRPGTACAPNGESIPVFHQRIIPTLESLLAEFQGEHLLVVSHGAVIRAAMCHWLGMPLDAITRLSVPYACLTRFKVYDMPDRDPWVQLSFHRGD